MQSWRMTVLELWLMIPALALAADPHAAHDPTSSVRPPSGEIKEFTHIDSLVDAGILNRNTDIVPVDKFVERMYDVGSDEKGAKIFDVKKDRDFEVWNIGPEKKTIKGGTDLGPIIRENGSKIVEEAIKRLPKLATGEPNLNREILIYCGCCPAHSCPFVIGAVQVLKKRGLTNVKVINFEEELQSDWIDKGMPTQPRDLIMKK